MSAAGSLMGTSLGSPAELMGRHLKWRATHSDRYSYMIGHRRSSGKRGSRPVGNAADCSRVSDGNAMGTRPGWWGAVIAAGNHWGGWKKLQQVKRPRVAATGWYKKDRQLQEHVSLLLTLSKLSPGALHTEVFHNSHVSGSHGQKLQYGQVNNTQRNRLHPRKLWKVMP